MQRLRGGLSDEETHAPRHDQLRLATAAVLLDIAYADGEFSPAEGASGDVAKVLISAARSGLHAIHLVGGDPFGRFDT